MGKEYKIYEKEYQLTTNDINVYGDITPTAVLNILQDISCDDAFVLGCDYNTSVTKDAIWVLTRSLYKLDPKKFHPYMKIKAFTWPNKNEKFSVNRNYLIKDIETNEIILRGVFKWAIISYSTRRMLPTNILVDEDVDYPSDIALTDKIDAIQTDENILDKEYQFKVMFSSLDQNGHMNNTKYLEQLLNACPLEENEKIVSLLANYIRELPYNHTIKIKYLKNDEEIIGYFYLEDGVIATKIKLGLIKN
ncbi:MAG: acyl-[acyl-carrier-protein] thioesterase [Bacilli bacterium]